MRLRARLLVFGYPLLEIVTIYLVALWLGWGWTLLLVLVGIPAGIAIMRNAGDRAMRELRAAQATGGQVEPGRHAPVFVAGLLIAIPGFWTDLVGILLLLPPTRRLFTRRGQAWLDSRLTTVRMPGVRYPGGDIVPGTVIHVDDLRDEPPAGPTPPGPAGPPGALPPA